MNAPVNAFFIILFPNMIIIYSARVILKPYVDPKVMSNVDNSSVIRDTVVFLSAMKSVKNIVLTLNI
jgi:hypothetical protein